ncbi:MAG: bis(5'-nucleosyl)-tetraphosphatase (symmetrical) YqeK [Muricoprocola sp.]
MSYNILKMKKTLRKYLTLDRYEHTEGVMYTAAALAMKYGEDVEKALVAGLLHDCAKCIPDSKKIKICKKHHIEVTELELNNPFLLHAKLGAFLAKDKYDIEDQEILDAIACHTTGKPAMTLLDKIIYISDYIEPMRSKAPNLADVRRLAFEDIDVTLFKILSDTLEYLKNSSKTMDCMTLKTYEYYKNKMIEQE